MAYLPAKLGLQLLKTGKNAVRAQVSANKKNDSNLHGNDMCISGFDDSHSLVICAVTKISLVSFVIYTSYF